MKHSFTALFFTFCVKVSARENVLPQRDSRAVRETSEALPRTVGGREASAGEYPFYVEWNGCGGALIHPDIVLSAANCHEAVDNVTVIVGSYETQTTNAGAEVRYIGATVPHPGRNVETREYDFVILQLTEPSTKLPIVVNYETSIPSDRELLTAIGFGDLHREGNDEPPHLQVWELEHVPYDMCNEYTDGIIVNEIEFCAGPSGKTACIGGSGDPIFTEDHVLVGVASFGPGCVESVSLGVYGRTSGIGDWIAEQICALSADPPASCTEEVEQQVLIKLTLDFDRFPEEVNVAISSLPDGDTVHFFSNFSYIETFVTSFYLAPGTYGILLTDSAGDGFCCELGMGRFQVEAILDDDRVVLLDERAKFSFALLEEFTVPDLALNATIAPSIDNSTYTCDELLTGNDTCIVITYFLDDYPWEIFSHIMSARGLVYWEVYDIREPGLFVDSVRLEPGDYVLRLIDDADDGICCKYGNGYIEVFAVETDGNVTLLAEANGIFGHEKEVFFTVPSWDD